MFLAPARLYAMDVLMSRTLTAQKNSSMTRHLYSRATRELGFAAAPGIFFGGKHLARNRETTTESAKAIVWVISSNSNIYT